MTSYVAHRLVELPLVLVIICSILFIVLRLSGDPVSLLVPSDATKEDIELLRERMGLDQPLHVQYLKFMRGMTVLDFGDSLVARRPAREMVLDRLPATLELTVTAMVVALVVAVPAGLLAARGGVFGAIARFVSITGQAMPVFWLGVLLVLLFSVKLGMLPSFGRGDVRHLILPALTLGLLYMAKTSRLVRSGMIEVMGEDYIRTARAKGLNERSVVARHALRNIAIPVVTNLGVDVSYLLSGAVVTETVFTWPGLGRQLMQAVLSRDYPVVQATVFVVASLTVLVNLIIDTANAHLDPRIVYGRKS